MELLLALVLVGRQAENTVRLLAEALGLVEGKELEVGALVLLQRELELDEGVRVALEWLNACVILPNEALELG